MLTVHKHGNVFCERAKFEMRSISRCDRTLCVNCKMITLRSLMSFISFLTIVNEVGLRASLLLLRVLKFDLVEFDNCFAKLC